MAGSTPDTQEPKFSEREQQLQELEPAEPSSIRDAKTNVHLRTLSVKLCRNHLLQMP